MLAHQHNASIWVRQCKKNIVNICIQCHHHNGDQAARRPRFIVCSICGCRNGEFRLFMASVIHKQPTVCDRLTVFTDVQSISWLSTICYIKLRVWDFIMTTKFLSINVINSKFNRLLFLSFPPWRGVMIPFGNRASPLISFFIAEATFYPKSSPNEINHFKREQIIYKWWENNWPMKDQCGKCPTWCNR